MVKKEGNAGGNPTDKLVPRVLPNTWKAQNWRKKILKSAKLREVAKPIAKFSIQHHQQKRGLWQPYLFCNQNKHLWILSNSRHSWRKLGGKW